MARVMIKKEIQIRRIPVRVGDVFRPGFPLVVVRVNSLTQKAEVRAVDTGRRSKIAIERLQREFHRASEREADACHRALARIDAQRARWTKRRPRS